MRADGEPLDPSRLRTSWRPAFVDERGNDGRALGFVADARVTDQGWLRARTWVGETHYLPPQQVRDVRLVERETYNPADAPPDVRVTRIVDDDLREEARRLAQSTADGVAGGQEVPADD